MATRLGKLLRKIRIDRDEYMKNMAERLGITSAYLSAIENGKRNMGNALLEKLAEVYSLPEDALNELKEAAIQSKDKIEIGVASASENKQNVAWTLARKFDDLSDRQIDQIQKILEGGE